MNQSDLIFNNCIKLVGGAGIKYDFNSIDKKCVKGDNGDSDKGYFNYKAN